MDIGISPGIKGGKIDSIASKSDVHRLMICALLCDKPVVIKGVSRCADIDATTACIRALGAQVDITGRTFTVTPPAGRTNKAHLDCSESGSTLRFLLPVASVLCDEASFTGSGRLPQRPIGELAAAMSTNGARFSDDRLPFSV